MIVTIFGSTGLVGRQLITHAFAKGWQVRAFGRDMGKFIDRDLHQKDFTTYKGYVFDAGDVAKAVKGSDAIMSALGGKMDGSDSTRSLGMKNIVAQLEKHGPKRIVAIGGLGVLPAADGTPLYEQKEYPQLYVPVAKEHFAAYQHLKNSSLDWSFLCPPAIEDAEANGHFELQAEAQPFQVAISAGNLAMAMIQMIENKSFIHQRVGIANT